MNESNYISCVGTPTNGHTTLRLASIEAVARAMYRHRIEKLRIYLDRPELYDEAVERGWRCCEGEAKAALDTIIENVDVSVWIGKHYLPGDEFSE